MHLFLESEDSEECIPSQGMDDAVLEWRNIVHLEVIVWHLKYQINGCDYVNETLNAHIWKLAGKEPKVCFTRVMLKN